MRILLTSEKVYSNRLVRQITVVTLAFGNFVNDFLKFSLWYYPEVYFVTNA